MCLCGITKVTRPSSLYSAHVSLCMCLLMEKQKIFRHPFFTQTQAYEIKPEWQTNLENGPSRNACTQIFVLATFGMKTL